MVEMRLLGEYFTYPDENPSTTEIRDWVKGIMLVEGSRRVTQLRNIHWSDDDRIRIITGSLKYDDTTSIFKTKPAYPPSLSLENQLWEAMRQLDWILGEDDEDKDPRLTEDDEERPDGLQYGEHV